MALLVAINRDAMGQGSKIGALATHNDEAKMVMGEIAFDAKGVAPRGAIGAAVLHFDFPGDRPCVSQALPRATVGNFALAHLAELAPPSHEFVGVEMRVPAIGQRCERAVLKADLGGVGAFGRPRCIPVCGEGAK